MAKTLTIDGVSYPIIENCGFSHDIGARVWIVEMPDGSSKTVIGRVCGAAHFWTDSERTTPLRDAVAKGWPISGSGVRGQ